MAVRVVREGSFPLVTAMLVVRVGETASPAGQDGLAALTADILEGGTHALSSEALARLLEDIGASYGATTGWDSTAVAVSCMAEHLGEATAILGDIIRTATFASTEFDRCRAQRVATARHRAMDPAAVAADAHARFMYRKGDTYARPLGGTEASLESLASADARTFSRRHYGPGTTALVVVGDLEASEVVAIAEESLGGWDRKTGVGPEPKASPRHREGTVHVVHRPGAVQSEIRVGHLGVSRAVRDYFPLRLLNLVLGGSFSSRLNLNLREKRGFTYGVRSGFAARRGPGPFVVSTAVETSVTGRATAEIVKEIKAIAEHGPSKEEVEAARSYLAGVFPLRMETTGQLASAIAEMVVYDLPQDYFRSYRERIRDVTLEQAIDAGRNHIRAGELCTVVVGDAEAVVSQMEALGIGKVSVHEGFE